MDNIIKEVKQFWESCFAETDFDFKPLARKDFSNIIERLRECHAKMVLDLGCGFGHWSIALAKAGFQVKAIDISSKAIEKLQEWASEEKLSIDTEVCPAQEINLIDEKFDAVICNSVLDHMPFADAFKVMFNIKDIIKPNGIVYISFDGLEEENGEEFVMLSDGTRIYAKGEREGILWRFYTNEEIKTLCKDMEILKFIEKKNGKREAWVRKK